MNFWLGAALLLAMLFQSFHAFEHLAEQFSTQHCDHHYNVGKTEVGHAHPDLETCFACEFTFSNFTAATAPVWNFEIIRLSHAKRIFSTMGAPLVFEGAMLSLRGPPLFTVA